MDASEVENPWLSDFVYLNVASSFSKPRRISSAESRCDSFSFCNQQQQLRGAGVLSAGRTEHWLNNYVCLGQSFQRIFPRIFSRCKIIDLFFSSFNNQSEGVYLYEPSPRPFKVFFSPELNYVFLG